MTETRLAPSFEILFEIPEEKDLHGKVINADIYWLVAFPPDDFQHLPAIEGKLYLPHVNARNELILFTPGFPGGNAGRFEQRYAKALIDEGYAFFTIRHNGTSLTNGATSFEILNSQKRMELAVTSCEHHIGGTRSEGYSPTDIIEEPIGPLLGFSEMFETIHLMGQSMGVAASYNAIRVLSSNHVIDSIGNVVGIAGYVGRTGECAGIWDGLKMPFSKFADYQYEYVAKVDANICPKERFRGEMKKVAEANEDALVPDHVGNILVFASGDPLIDGPAGDSVYLYGPPTRRKVVIRDETNTTDSKQHSMLWISPENLIRAVQARVSAKGPHYVKLPMTRGLTPRA